jgi:hypothetical protein
MRAVPIQEIMENDGLDCLFQVAVKRTGDEGRSKKRKVYSCGGLMSEPFEAQGKLKLRPVKKQL